MSEKLLVSRRGGVVTLTFNRPEVRNALDHEMTLAFRDAMLAEAKHPDTRVIVMTGAAGAFGSGADIRAAVAAGLTPADAHRMLTEAFAPAIQAIYTCRWPVIAAVDGPAVGISCDFALAADIRLVSTRGYFAESFIRLGLIPDGGGTYMLPRLIGLGRALEAMFTGEKIEAEEAVRIGLANRVFSAETFAESVARYADQIGAQSPQALMLGKRAMRAALEDRHIADAMWREADFQRQILESEDGFEGFLSFVEKRPPVWKWRG